MTSLFRRAFLMMVVLCVCAISSAQADKKFKLTGKEWERLFPDIPKTSGAIKIDKKDMQADFTRVPPDVVSVSQGAFFGCAVKTLDRSVWCWGEGWYGGLGQGQNLLSSDVPQPVLESVTLLPLRDVVQVDVSGYSACALKKDQTVWCWGYAREGLLPFFFGDKQSTAAQVIASVVPRVPLTGIKQITVGNQLVCAIREIDGRVYCWGHNPYGGLGWGGLVWPPDDRLETITNPEIKDMVSIDAQAHVCAARKDGRVWCWGWNFDDQVGQGLVERVFDPTEVMDGQNRPLKDVVSVAVRSADSCVLTSKGEVYCWGNCGNILGQVPIDCRPFPLPLLDAAKQPIQNALFLKANGGHLCLIRNDFTLWCGGSNAAGQLGDGTRINRPDLVPVNFGIAPGPVRALYVAPGSYVTCYVTTGGKLACWGDDQRGALGDGNGEMNSMIPVLVDF